MLWRRDMFGLARRPVEGASTLRGAEQQTFRTSRQSNGIELTTKSVAKYQVAAWQPQSKHLLPSGLRGLGGRGFRGCLNGKFHQAVLRVKSHRAWPGRLKRMQAASKIKLAQHREHEMRET